MAKKIKVKLILELQAAQMSQREICRTRKMSQHSVGDVFKIAKELGITYQDIHDKTDEDVYQMFYPDKYSTETLYKVPDYTFIHSELKRTGVTLKLLWEEYKDSSNSSGNLSMGYTKFCEGYSDHVAKNSLANHLVHKPGMVCEVDWGGSTMSISDNDTGEIIKIYLFVATLPYSQYSYIEPCLDMKQNTWLKCHVNMFEYFGGSTVRIVCDNLKTGVISHPREGDILLNESYENLGNHYLSAIMPTGVKKPKHKPSVEGTVGKIATAIIAKLRNQTYYSLEELKIAITERLKDFNAAPFQKREGSRLKVFKTVEKDYLRPLPVVPFEVSEWVHGHTVALDCHVAYMTNRYSVPFKYVGKKVDLKVTESLVEIYLGSERIYTHMKFPKYAKYKWSTIEEHMPDQFNQAQWDDERIKKWANSVGPFTSEVIERIFSNVSIKEQGYNSALSVLRISKKYSNERLEAACGIALERIRYPRYRNIMSVLTSNMDLIALKNNSKSQLKEAKNVEQGYVRGSQFYSGGDH